VSAPSRRLGLVGELDQPSGERSGFAGAQRADHVGALMICAVGHRDRARVGQRQRDELDQVPADGELACSGHDGGVRFVAVIGHRAAASASVA